MNLFRPRKVLRNIKLAAGGVWKLRSLLVYKTTRATADIFLKERQQNLVFMLGTGRSGTQLVSDLLAASGNAIVFHEPNFIEDVGSMERFYRDEALVRDYWQRFRQYEIYRRWARSPEKQVYGEVNGTIRYHVPGIRHVFPDARLFLLARDGRGVVRSVMGWPRFYGPRSTGAYAIALESDGPYAAAWESMSRFEKICWAWMESNEFLMKAIPRNCWFRLEALVEDYAAAGGLFGEIGLQIGRSEWQEIVSRPSANVSSSYAFPPWKDWQPTHQRQFREICGLTMEKLGYRIC